jgi:hypothetical protein
MRGRCKSVLYVRSYTLVKLTYDNSHESALWNESESLMESPPFLERRTQPRPDLTFAFPTQGTSSNDPKGLSRNELFQMFSRPVLGNLISHGLSCVPTTGLRRWTKNPKKAILKGLDTSCFPYAVVEMKRDDEVTDESARRCYCQAANAAAVALELQAQLFDKLGELSPARPPVIAFTCVGPIVRVWLAYQYQPTRWEKRKTVRPNRSPIYEQ